MQLVLVLRRDHPRVIGKFAVDQLRYQLDRSEAESRLVGRELDRDLVIAVRKELGELEYRLSRHDHLLSRQFRWPPASAADPRPPSADRSGSSGCPAAPSHTGPGPVVAAALSGRARSAPIPRQASPAAENPPPEASAA